MRVSTRPTRSIIAPKNTKVDFNMIGGIPTLHLQTKGNTIIGILITKNDKIELTPTDTSTPRLTEVNLINQAYLKITNSSNKISAGEVELNVKGADKLKSVDRACVSDIKIFEIVNNKKIKLL